MTTSVLVDDFVANRRWNFFYQDDPLVVNNWNNEDKLLVDLSETTLFGGLTRWSDLRPIHYKILIIRNFHHMDKLLEHEFRDDDHPTMRSLHFLIGCMIKCVADRSDTHLEVFKIRRVAPESVNFDFTASLFLELGETPSTGGLKVVVDNTR